MKDNMRMFCFQCQETARGRGCTLRGVCGKEDEVANLQDLLIWVLKGLSFYGVSARGRGFVDADVDRFVLEALFATITNANFDPARFETLIHEAVEMRDRIAGQAGDVKGAPEPATWHPGDADLDDLIAKGERVGVLYPEDVDEDIRSLRETLTYGIKGMAAYIDHAYVLGAEDEDLLEFMQEGLAATLDDGLSTDDLVNLVLECGHRGVQAMALLDSANTGTYGNPEPTDVSIGVKEGPAILISGHDLRDMEELLKQTEGTGINVYTHGEMLPANAYPAFKKYDHLAGNYGGSWWRQQDEFEKFGGAILLTTNCLVPPKDSYSDRLFTTGTVGWPGVAHISDREDGKPKDFGPVIERALSSDSPEELETGTIPIGFAHAAVTSIADQIVEAVKAGKIKRFVVMSGCDGRFKTRSYFTEIAEAFPQDYVILTSGCAKYRYNKLGLGDIDGIPRVLDMGQCNDSYSAVVIAQKLAEAFGVEDVNDLPLSFDVAWYEQKAVLVLLALLALGIRNIHLGPTLPAFLSSNVLNVLVEKFNIQPTDTVEQDLELIAAGS